jgi:hypothetical protein
MSEEVNKKSEEELNKEEFYKIKNLQDDLLYTTNSEELTEVLVSILSTGAYTKTFSLFKGKIELTYTSITEQERMKGFGLIRINADENIGKQSQIEANAYNSKVNMALQLIRIKVNNNKTELTKGDLKERIQLLEEMPEEQLKLINKYLIVFSNITNKAFESEEYLKNS